MQTKAWGRCLIGVLIFMAILACAGCQAVPPEVVVGNEIQQRAIAAWRRDELRIITAYHRELIRSYRAHADDRMKMLLASRADSAGAVPVTVVAELLAQRDDRVRDIEAELQGRLEEFTSNPNYDLLLRLSQAEGRYLGALNEAARHVEAILGEGLPVDSLPARIELIGGKHE